MITTEEQKMGSDMIAIEEQKTTTVMESLA